MQYYVIENGISKWHVIRSIKNIVKEQISGNEKYSDIY